MIEFISNKKINYSRIQELLNISKKNNHYTNNGPLKKELESTLHKLLDIDTEKKVLCCNNGTTALHTIMFFCAKKNQTGYSNNWVTPAFTFPSCVVGHNFNIDILDINSNTYTLELNKTTLNKYDGIILTNLFGSYVDISKWVSFCKDNKKTLIFDNAASPLSSYNGTNICNFGDYSFGSLHHTKYLGFGEGGFIICPKEEYDTINSITNFGFLGSHEYKLLSSNFKMSDISAAFILNHIESYNIKKHYKNQNKLIKGISKINHAKPFNYKTGTIYNTFPVLFNKEINLSYFDNYNIKVQKYHKPLLPLNNSYSLFNKIINFPLYAQLNQTQINNIINSIRNTNG